ncbi:MAG: amidase [Chloroflexi bacterium]|nr:amidase [Chloroflexota bacterium]
MNLSSGLPALARALRSGELPIAEYLSLLEAQFLAREPSVSAFVAEEGRFERLRGEAETLLAQYPDPEVRPPLFGIPIGVKDIFHVAGFTTRAGSKLPPEILQGPEAESVTLLKKVGALILGNTVTTEFAYFGPGPTCNPHNIEHTPGGSSSGSAAAVAAGMCPLTLGTQTIGSIVRPASFCGVVGYKPTYDRISRAGVIPLSPSLDHIGLFTVDVAGAQLAASLLCRDWTRSAEIRDLKKPVLGIPEGPYLNRASTEMLEHFRATCRKLAKAGYELRPVNAMPDFDAIYERHFLITNAEAARVHQEWFPRFRDLYHFKTVEKLEAGRAVSDEALAQALGEREKFSDTITRLMDEHQIDLWISPSAVGPAPKGLDSTGDPVMNLPWSQAGLPSINLPSGRSSDGLPLGLQLTARWQDDEELFEWAIDFEKLLAITNNENAFH